MIFFKKAKNNHHLRLFCLFCLTLLLACTYKINAQEKFTISNGSDEIIVLFNSNISVAEQNDILNFYNNQVTILEQIEDYALCKVHNSLDRSSILKSLNKNPNIYLKVLISF